MYDVDELIEKLARRTGRPREELIERVRELRDRWGISEEGAALALAAELGVDLMEANEEERKPVTLDRAISEGLKSFDAEFVVVRAPEVIETQSGGRMATAVIADETRSAALVAFNEAVERLRELEEGDVVRGENLRLTAFRGSPQVVVERDTSLRVIDEHEDPEGLIERTTSELRHGEYVRVRGIVVSEPTDTGERVHFWLSDEEGSARVNAWGDAAERALELEYGQGAVVEGWVSTRGGTPVINVLRTHGLVKPAEVSVRPAIKRRVRELKEGDVAEISGVVVAVYARRRYYEACPRCGRAVRDGECPEHGPVEPERRPVLNLVVDDGTGTVRVAFFGDLAVDLAGCESPREFLEAEEETLRERLLGANVSVVVRVRGEGVVEDYDAVALRGQTLDDEDLKREASLLLRELEGEERA
jgi:replication factor A1